MNEKLYGKLQRTIDNKEEYIEFQNPQETEKWGQQYYLEWANKYKKVMQLAEKVITTKTCTKIVECYCGYCYKHINQYLREEVDNESNSYREMANILAMVLSTAPRVPHNVVLYRMVSDDFIKMLIANNKKEMPTPFQEKGFMSTSLLKSIANQNEPYAVTKNLLKIFAPKDTVGIYVNAVTRRSEEEMLLFPNMYLGLISYPYKDKETGKMIYECELIKYYL